MCVCFSETLRIFTPLPYMSKVCTQSCELINSDGVALQVQPGDVCIIPLHSVHHDEEYYPQPEDFVPERFAEASGGTKKYKDLGVYFPFGDGPRICLGRFLIFLFQFFLIIFLSISFIFAFCSSFFWRSNYQV